MPTDMKLEITKKEIIECSYDEFLEILKQKRFSDKSGEYIIESSTSYPESLYLDLRKIN